MTRRRCATILAIAVCASVIGLRVAAASTDPTVAFCRVHPTMDYPGRAFHGPNRSTGPLPAEVQAAQATDWRCMDRGVLVCGSGASGSACARMDASRKPQKLIREFCEDNPGSDFVARYAIGNSASTWRCRGGTPEIIHTEPLDKRGFMRETWSPLSRFPSPSGLAAGLAVDPR
jgi:hypothetical protein